MNTNRMTISAITSLAFAAIVAVAPGMVMATIMASDNPSGTTTSSFIEYQGFWEVAETVGYDATQGPWIKNLQLSENSLTYGLNETITWETSADWIWTDWHEEILTVGNGSDWIFTAASISNLGPNDYSVTGVGTSAVGFLFANPIDSGSLEFIKTVQCTTTSNIIANCDMDEYTDGSTTDKVIRIAQYPTVERKQPNPTPEPGTMLLLGTGLIGLAGRALRRRSV